MNNKLKNKIEFILWYDEKKYLKKFVLIFEKYFDISIGKLDDEVEFHMWNYTIKLYNKVWQRNKLNNCFFMDSIYNLWDEIEFGTNFHISCLEVLLEWDIRAHEPPCWFWDIRLSNIYRTNHDILNDFDMFSDYINEFNIKLKNYNQLDICNKCIKNKYKYE